MFHFNDRCLGLKAALVCKSNKIKANLNGLWSAVARCAHQPHSERAIMMRYVIHFLASIPSIVGNNEGN